MSRRSRLILPAAALLLSSPFLAACGGSEGESKEAKPYVDAMVASMTEDEDAPFNEEEARCFSEKMIDVVGLKKFEDAGTPEEFKSGDDSLDFESLKLDRKQGEEIYDNFDKCGVDMRDELLKEMSADEEYDAETKKCLEEGLTDDVVKDFFVSTMVEGEDSLDSEDGPGAELMSTMMECMMAGMDIEE
jgi:hypothetical protein